MLIEISFLIFGLISLWFSAELTIRCVQVIADKFKISGTFIGLAVLSTGAILPEIRNNKDVKNHQSIHAKSKDFGVLKIFDFYETGGMLSHCVDKWFLTPESPPSIALVVFEHTSHHPSKMGGISLFKNKKIKIIHYFQQ